MTWGAMVAAALGLGVALLLSRPPSHTTNEVNAIAVLPFANLSGKADEEYLADGMTDMLTSNLAQWNALRVTSRTSAMRFKDAREPVANIGRALRVDAVVEGSMMHANGHVRVTAQVIRVSTDEHVWSRTFERQDGDVFALQAEVASAIANAIKLAVSPPGRAQAATHAVNPEAQDAYLRGRYLIQQEGRDKNLRALEELKRAVALDPSYARAYATLARCYILLANFGEMTHAAAYAAAYDAAQHAIALDDGVADAHSELADLLLYERWDWRAAAHEYERALELDASHTLARSHYSRYLSAIGRHAEALAQARLTVDGDPFSVDALETPPLALFYAAHYTEAAAGFRDALLVFPNNASTHFGLARALAAARDFDAAEQEIIEATRLVNGYIGYRLEGVRVLITAGQKGEGLAQLRAIETDNTTLPTVHMAAIYGALGVPDKAFEYLNRAVQERTPNLLWARVDPRLEPLRNDPRFGGIVRALGIPEQ
jgi:TolB-like protein/tetratricopeptide (TPR) repeat protein